MVGQLLLQPGAHDVARPYLPGVDLGESLLNFADEPVVVVDGSLDGFANQHVPSAKGSHSLCTASSRRNGAAPEG
jgi:hypothetical protein